MMYLLYVISLSHFILRIITLCGTVLADCEALLAHWNQSNIDVCRLSNDKVQHQQKYFHTNLGRDNLSTDLTQQISMFPRQCVDT